MSDESTPTLFKGFSETTDEQFDAVYDAMSEEERKRFARNFFVMFCRLIDGQAVVMDKLLADAKADQTKAKYTISYGQSLAETMQTITIPLNEAVEMWRDADGRH